MIEIITVIKQVKISMINTAFLPIDDTNLKTFFNLDRDRKTAQRKIAPRKRAPEQIPFGLRLWSGLG